MIQVAVTRLPVQGIVGDAREHQPLALPAKGRPMTTKSFDPRKLMELAVDVMVKSKQLPRSDGKASPLVGAVLWNDGATDTGEP